MYLVYCNNGVHTVAKELEDAKEALSIYLYLIIARNQESAKHWYGVIEDSELGKLPVEEKDLEVGVWYGCEIERACIMTPGGFHKVKNFIGKS